MRCFACGFESSKKGDFIELDFEHKQNKTEIGIKTYNIHRKRVIQVTEIIGCPECGTLMIETEKNSFKTEVY